jgi:hypothetical protein
VENGVLDALTADFEKYGNRPASFRGLAEKIFGDHSVAHTNSVGRACRNLQDRKLVLIVPGVWPSMVQLNPPMWRRWVTDGRDHLVGDPEISAMLESL